MHIRSIDLNLLAVFEAVFEESSMSRAAARLAMTQPAVSHAIDRLRHVSRSTLFMRSPRGVVATAGARQLYAQVKPALDLIRDGLGQARDFDPGQSQRAFQVALGLPPPLAFVTSVLRAFQAQSPLSTLVARIAGRASDVADPLRDGTLDLAVLCNPVLGREQRSEALWSDEPVVIARRGHPRLKSAAPGRAALLREHFVRVCQLDAAEDPFDPVALFGPSVRLSADLAAPVGLPVLVSQTDYVAIASGALVRTLAKPLGLRSWPLPGGRREVVAHAVWHASRELDGGHRWLRGVLRLAGKVAHQYSAHAAT